MKKYIGKHMLMLWIIISIVTIVIVHFLYYFPAPFKWMIANWSSGEILTYISTVALSLLAVWQNKRFKEENDISQARLEQLVRQANEISLINKIIEIENERLNQIKETMDDFGNACNPELIVTEFLKSDIDKVEKDSGNLIVRTQIVDTIHRSYFKLSRLLNTDYSLKDLDKSLIKSISDYYNITMKTINACLKGDTEEMDANVIISYRNEYLFHRERYIKSLEDKLELVIFGNMNLEEIKKLYHSK